MQTNTIVVAEDEPLVRLAAVCVLEDAGFEVVEAEHAEAALTALHAKAHSVVVLFTDVNIPGHMDGLALAHHVRKTWPHISILVASGKETPTATELPSNTLFISKSYELDGVVEHIRSLAGG